MTRVKIPELPDYDRREWQRTKGFLRDRTMVICFCDLVGSTIALRRLGSTRFREVQKQFLKDCGGAVSTLIKNNQSELPVGSKRSTITIPGPVKGHTSRVVLDKFLGDGALFYIDCGQLYFNDAKAAKIKNRPEWTDYEKAEIKRWAAIKMMELISAIVSRFGESNRKFSADRLPVTLGARFGVTIGDEVALSTLGDPPWESVTVTGEAVNLSARLEHATEAEFLQAITEQRSRLAPFSGELADKTVLHGTAIGNEQAALDRNIVDLYEVTRKSFQIRADSAFVRAIESPGNLTEVRAGNGGDVAAGQLLSRRTELNQLAWKIIPFNPRGFGTNDGARIVGGDSIAELFRIV